MPRVRLMLTCLCDAFYGEVGIATVKVLEAAGCVVEFDPDQTCCGQPAFNAGAWDEARSVATHCLSVFDGDAPIVAPSSSCVAMIRHGYPMLFDAEIQGQAFELAEYLVRERGITSWPAKKEYPKRVALHRACHGRGIGLADEQETLLKSIPGLELVPFEHGEQCCGFGGAFSVTHGAVSEGIGREKLERIMASGADELVSGDMGCLVHLNGLISRHKLNLRTRHFAEILAEVTE